MRPILRTEPQDLQSHSSDSFHGCFGVQLIRNNHDMNHLNVYFPRFFLDVNVFKTYPRVIDGYLVLNGPIRISESWTAGFRQSGNDKDLFCVSAWNDNGPWPRQLLGVFGFFCLDHFGSYGFAITGYQVLIQLR